MSNAHVPSITGAPESLAEDQARRTRRYLVQMGVRLVCFLSAIFLAKDVLWLQLLLLAAAVVLPYSAVLFANAGRDRVTYDTSPVTGREPAALPAEPAAAPAGGTVPAADRVIEHQDERDADDEGEGEGERQDDRQDESPQGTTEDDR
ncbi:DUF3099 domain-containing protein [Isoptericola cucumis]|uniref:DUF3099 domain-containing protein n=1 Tax=Isoptericola cucumis TaxID=1776856 RepID=UPI00320849C7